MNRRRFLYSTTAVVACAGLAAAMWPFIDQMDPDAAVKAATEFPQYDLTGLRPRQLLTVRWHDIPVFVAVRTQAMLAAMQESAFVVQLVDPDSRASRQPAFAENFYRSRDPALAVLVGICPSCRCVPQYIAETSALGVVGGYACPCCATRYDPAGRAYYGLARFNLAVRPLTPSSTARHCWSAKEVRATASRSIPSSEAVERNSANGLANSRSGEASLVIASRACRCLGRSLYAAVCRRCRKPAKRCTISLAGTGLL